MAQTLLDAKGLTIELNALIDQMIDGVGRPIEEIALVGVKTRGAVMARRMQAYVLESRGVELPLGELDITLYRDDLSQLASHPMVKGTSLEFDIQGKTLLLIDDVLYTGRTIRSALDELVDFGRPNAIRLGVMVDRGWRELPIQADFCAIEIETTNEQVVKVMLSETDGEDRVVLAELPS